MRARFLVDPDSAKRKVENRLTLMWVSIFQVPFIIRFKDFVLQLLHFESTAFNSISRKIFVN